MKYEVINSLGKLRELYDAPMDLAVKKQKDKTDKYSDKFLSLSSFAILSTVGKDGLMDCSPRGDFPGFINVIDERTIAIPDRPGNNRLDSLGNIIENPNVGLLVLVQGFKECLRINGGAEIVSDTNLLNKFEYRGKLPKSVIVITIKEIYFHCAKAITRSKLWDPASQVDRNTMPSFGRILMGQAEAQTSEAEIQEVEALIEGRLKTHLY